MHLQFEERKLESTVTKPDGETASLTVRMKVMVQYVMELDKAVIAAFDADGTLLTRDTLDWRSAKGEVFCASLRVWRT